MDDFPKFSDSAPSYNEAIGLTDSSMYSLGGIISKTLPYMLSIGGLVLLVMLISGGFTMMTAVSDPKAAEAGKQRITTALIGFFLLFATYWIFQLLEIVLGITILG